MLKIPFFYQRKYGILSLGMENIKYSYINCFPGKRRDGVRDASSLFYIRPWKEKDVAVTCGRLNKCSLITRDSVTFMAAVGEVRTRKRERTPRICRHEWCIERARSRQLTSSYSLHWRWQREDSDCAFLAFNNIFLGCLLVWN